MKAFTRILKTLAPQSTPRTSVELKADLAQVDIPALTGIVEALAIQRKALLVTGNDDQLRANAARLDDARLAVERAEAIAEELQRRIAEVEKREADEAIAGTVAEAKKLHDEIDADQAELDKLADRLAGMLHAHRAKLHALGHHYKAIAMARGVKTPAGKVPDIALVRRRVVDRIGLH